MNGTGVDGRPRPRIVVVGTSLGGLRALKTLLRALPADFPLPIAIVQHVAETHRGDLSMLLAGHTALPVTEPEDKQAIEAGKVYVAPAGYHLLVESDGTFALSTDAPELYARPSIDVLFESAAEVYGAGVIGVALTAASEDGARGMLEIQRRGGRTIVEDPATAESPVLPKAVLAATKNRVDRVLPVKEIGPCLASLVATGNTVARSPGSGRR